MEVNWFEEVLASMKARPDAWDYSFKYTFDCKHANVQIWVANGFWFYGFWNRSAPAWSLLQKARFAWAFRQWKKTLQSKPLGLPL